VRVHPDARTLWHGPRWALAALLALLGMVGPFAIDTYLPAFVGIARSLNASPAIHYRGPALGVIVPRTGT
jgi:DHA1 family bicyclomycin/chloramphenicol resistance-like MFS transporter